jgi:hypothetical protein
MSSIKLQGNAAGTGVVTLASPDTNSSYTVTMPAASGTMATTDTAQTLTNKTLTSPTLTTPNIDSAQFATVSGTAPLYAARAWVNFNGTGTVAIRSSGNITSITDNNTGDYTVNFTTAMPDANYAITGTASRAGTSGSAGAGVTVTPNDVVTARTSSEGRIILMANAGDGAFDSAVDSAQTNIVIFR